MNDFKQVQIQKMKNLSDLIQINIDALSRKIEAIKDDFNKSAADEYYNVKHIDKWQCDIIKSIASDIQKANSELWTIGQCLEQYEQICKKTSKN